MVTCCAAGLGIDLELLLELLAELLGGSDAGVVGHVFGHILVAVIKIEDLLERAQVLLGGTVTVETPTHGVGLGLIDHFHLINVTVTALTGDAAVHVGGVIEVDVVGRLVDADPFDGLAVVLRMSLIH